MPFSRNATEESSFLTQIATRRARVDAKLNIDAERFNSEGYTENESTELAARGLYGEYALFFPAQMLRASSRDGLDLRKLDDVRIRFDFTSFAR